MDVTLASLAMDINVGQADPAIDRLAVLKTLSADLEVQFGRTGKAIGDGLGGGSAPAGAARHEASMRSLIQVYGDADVVTGNYAMSQEATAAMMLRNAAAQAAAAKEADQQARAVQRLTSAYDPLGGEILKTNRLLAEADKLYEQGALSANQYAAATDGLRRKIANLEEAQTMGVKSSRALQQATLGVGRQLTDIGVSIAGGQNILLVLTQQLPQLADGLKVAQMQGISFRAVMAGLAAELAPVLAVLAPIAIVAAAIGAAFAIGAQQINKENKDLVKGLGLTEEQLERVKNKTVTMGDVAVGTFNAAKGALMAAFGPEIKAAGKAIGDFYQRMVDDTVKQLKFVVGGFVGAYLAVKATWSLLPAAMGDLTITTANLVIGGVEKMINAAIGLLNALILKANGVAEKVGLDLMIPSLDLVAIDRLANQYAGKMTEVGTVGMKGMATGVTEGAAMVDAAIKAVTDETLKAASARMRKEAGKAPKKKAAAEELEESDLFKSAELFQRVSKVRGDAAEEEWKRVQRLVDEYTKLFKLPPSAGEELLAVLDRTTDRLDQVHNHAVRAGQGIRDAFGSVGGSINDAITALTRYGAENAALNANMQAAENERIKALEKAGANSSAIAEAQAKYHHAEMLNARERVQVELQTYGDMAGAAKSFFSEKSGAFKALEAVERGYRAVQMAMSLKAILLDKTETGSTVAMNAIKSASHGVVAVARALASLPFPLNLAAGAATAAALVAIGVKIAGGGGSGGTGPTAEQIQAGQGTGSVLGDSSAKSDSIAKALDQSTRAVNKDLEYSSEMVRSLRAIESSIGSVSSLLARQLTAGGSLSTEGLNLGTSKSGPGLGTTLLTGGLSAILPGLFGSKTTTTLVDQGLQFDAQSLADLLANGVDGSTYQTTQSTKKKKLFGITVSNRTSTNTSSGDLDNDLAQQLGLLVGSLKDSVLTAATAIGVEGAEAVLDSFQVNLGRISFKDLTGEEIQAQLEAVFGKLGDDLAAAVVPGLASLQKVGEGTLETLARVAREYQVVDVTMASIGKTFGSVGLSSIAARDRLVELAGGLDEFADQAAFFSENFLSEAEQLAPIQKAVTIEMARLGYAGVQTKDQFKALVMGIDVSTEAGAELYTALMAVAPAFAKVADAAAAAGTAVKSLAEQIADAIGSAASMIDDQINASTSASNQAKSAAANYRALSQSLAESIASLRGSDLSTLSPTQKLEEQRTGLDALFGRALSGDTSALSKLPQAATDFLNASRDVNASSAAYGADFDRVMEMLQQSGVSSNASAGVMDYQATLLDAQTGILKEIRDNLTKESPDIALLTKQASLLETIGTLLQDQTTQLITVNSTLVDANGNLIQGNSIIDAQTGQLVAVQSASTLSLAAAQAAAVVKTTTSQAESAALIAAANDNGVAQVLASTSAQTGQLNAAQAGAAGQIVAASASGAGQIVGATASQTGSLTGSNASTGAQVSAAQAAAAANIGLFLAAQTGQLNANQVATVGQIVLSQTGLGSLISADTVAALQAANQQLVATQAGNLLINTQTGAITTLDGHTVTGNTLIDAQTGAVTSVTGAVKDQTGAVVVGNQASDAIRNINALNNQYSEAMLKELVASSVTQDTTFATMVAGNTTMVGLLQQIRDLTASKVTEDAVAAAKAAADAAAAAAQAAADAAAAAAKKAADEAAAAAAAAAAQTPNWSSYLTSNPDVASEYGRLSKNYLKTQGIYSAEQFAEWHYYNYGKAEGRQPFAKGGVFTNGVVSQPTNFGYGQMGEAGPEAIVPLVRGPQGLGVRTSGADARLQAELVSLLKDIRAELQADKRQRGAAAVATNAKLDTLIDTMEATKRAAARRAA